MRKVLGLFTLALALAGCGELQLGAPVSGELRVGESVSVELPPAEERPDGTLRPGVKVYRLVGGDGPVRVGVVSAQLEGRARLRLTLYDGNYVVQGVSVARNHFALGPELAPLGLETLGLTPDPGIRLNFKAQAGKAYYLKVENFAPAGDTVSLYAEDFTPNPRGQGEAFSSGTVTGAIEFLGEFDRYDVASATGYLRLSYSGPLDLVALLYGSPSDPTPLALDSVYACAPISPATLLVVRDRGLARAGFDEEGSGRYTLELSNTPCP